MTKPTITILPPDLASLIAAGEVVERPASIVKELLENALDAGAKAINVELRDGGLALIRVSDDGSGLSRVDAPLAIKPFATSKIRQASDLQHIHTFGFRGEALSSIAAVARLDILTRTTAEVEGTQVTVQQGTAEITPAASPVGSSFTVSQLFSHTPARRKFLKGPLREQELVQETVVKYALGYPQVAFRLVADGRPRLALPAGSTLERIGAILGREVATEMQPVAWEALDLRIEGFVSKPAVARSRRDRQYFYVNGRPIRAGLLAVMLERPYAQLLPPARYPLAVLHIQLEPGFVDVNVHPQKTEVRFSRERRVYTAVTQAVSEALSEFPPLVNPDAENMAWPFADMASGYLLREDKGSYEVSQLTPLAHIYDTYILAQAEAGLLIVDQHTAHEQILYERLTSNSRQIESPEAMNPLQMGLTISEATLLENHLQLFRDLGFGLEAFGKQTFLIRKVPAVLQPHLGNQVSTSTEAPPKILLTTLLAELQNAKHLSPESQLDKLAQKAACVCALKAGDILNQQQMQTMLNDLLETWSPAACPHGRPIFIEVSVAELERRFGRR